ncbi:GTP pyrophosphokinase [Clostridia bacterium]|nr:GTP pyrophosphokinase [Clostridia bacterium]
MGKIRQVEQIICEINRIHQEFSADYFETGRVEKLNLSRTISNISHEHIYNYRLNLHESINDYLMGAEIEIKYFYRVKTRESIDDKIGRYKTGENQYPVNNWLNDIFGARIVLTADELENVRLRLEEWQDEFCLKNWYFREKEGYRGLHVYFKNKSNFYFPWELQIWDEKDVRTNIESHERLKRRFV